MFCKIVYNHIVIDIIDDPRWVIWANKSGRFLLTDETTANGIVASNGLEVFHISL